MLPTWLREFDSRIPLQNKTSQKWYVFSLKYPNIVLAIIMSLRINILTTSLFDYILIIGMAAAGSGLFLRTVFKKKKE